jgi:hypothetical protein
MQLVIEKPEIQNFNPSQVQRDYYNHLFRFAINHAGRRGGKTELAVRKVVKKGLIAKDFKRFFLGGPTYGHAKRLFWDRLKKLLKNLRVGWLDKSEVELRVLLPTGTEIWIIGFDRPERFDGVIWHGGIADEYGDMWEDVWPEHIRPALADTGGWCDFTGVPAGRNHYFKLNRDYGLNPEKKHWGSFHWRTEDVLHLYRGKQEAREEIKQAKEDLDPITYDQEYEGEFVSFAGRAYYQFNGSDHIKKQEYDNEADLMIALDFNVEPGVAALIQEEEHKTVQIDEIYIPKNSNTIKVCDKIILNYGKHKGHIYMYGDASGGARSTSQVAGSDWELVKRKLQPVFGNRLHFKIPERNPHIVSRVNAANSRLKSVSGRIRFEVDPKCRYTIQDFEGVMSDEGGGIRKDKKKDKNLTHLTDAIGYYISYEFPVDVKHAVKIQQF